MEMLYGKPCCLTARMQLGDQFFRIGLYGIAHIDILYQMIIFQMLLNNRNRIVSRDELMTDLWDNNEFVNDNALTVNISRLRGKLTEIGYENAIETRKKQGYCLT